MTDTHYYRAAVVFIVIAVLTALGAIWFWAIFGLAHSIGVAWAWTVVGLAAFALISLAIGDSK